MGRDRRREACGPETAQPTRITVLGCRRWPCLQTVKSGPTRCVLKNRPDLPQKNGGKFFKTQNSQGKRPGGSDLASGGGVTEIIDCNGESHLTLDGGPCGSEKSLLLSIYNGPRLGSSGADQPENCFFTFGKRARDLPVGTADRVRASGPLPGPVSLTYKYEPKAER